MSIRCSRRETYAAVPHHHGRYAMPGRRCHFLIPCGLAIIVRVDVDETRCDVAATGVVHFLRLAKVSTYCNNPVSRDCHIRYVGLAASAINDGSAANN